MSMDQTAEVKLLTELQEHPELFDLIRQSKLSELKLQQSLRERYPSELVRAALTLHELRQRAKDKFSQAEEMYFSRQRLEQATPEVVAQHKAQRFLNADSPIYDLCAGMGADSIAIARTGKKIISIDTSPTALAEINCNAQAYGVNELIHTEQRDVREVDVSRKWIHIDPDRRVGVKRAIRLEDYEPPLEFMQELTVKAKAGAIKLSPASNFGGKFHNCEIELISLNGECREATVWFGDAAKEFDWTATILPGGWSLSANPEEYYPQVGPISHYLYDPDPAVVRAGLIDVLTSECGITRLDHAEEYLTSETLIESPAFSGFQVLQVLPNNIKEIRKYFRSNPIGEIEIKCRHVPVNAEQMRKKIPLTGQGRKTLLIARLQGKTKAVVAERI